MTQIIVAAKALSDHMRHLGQLDRPTKDAAYVSTNEDRAARQKTIAELCDELDALAADERSVYQDFDRVRRKLYEIGGSAPVTLLISVALAYFAAGRIDG